MDNETNIFLRKAFKTLEFVLNDKEQQNLYFAVYISALSGKTCYDAFLINQNIGDTRIWMFNKEVKAFMEEEMRIFFEPRVYTGSEPSNKILLRSNNFSVGTVKAMCLSAIRKLLIDDAFPELLIN